MIRIVAVLLSLVAASNAHADEFMTLGAAKSAQLSGLLDHLLPIFQATANLPVHVVAVDAGQDVAIGERGEADALLLDDRAAEDKIVADGHGLDRRDAVSSDFVIVGPSSDPAGIRGLDDARKAFAQIAASGALFASRGDDSRTHRMELRLWNAAGIQPGKATAWYRELGQDDLRQGDLRQGDLRQDDSRQGMEAALNVAAVMNAYTIANRTAWANFKNRRNLEILSQGDAALFDTYGSILVSPAKWPLIKIAYARIWHEWLTTRHGRDAVASYKINGEQIFFPPRQAAH
jgi:tungstate transport system substrate-binding protein